MESEYIKDQFNQLGDLLGIRGEEGEAGMLLVNRRPPAILTLGDDSITLMTDKGSCPLNPPFPLKCPIVKEKSPHHVFVGTVRELIEEGVWHPHCITYVDSNQILLILPTSPVLKDEAEKEARKIINSHCESCAFGPICDSVHGFAPNPKSPKNHPSRGYPTVKTKIEKSFGAPLPPLFEREP